ncbi:oligogalacturonate-specific porin KdgM family protein [Serratia entomophila]|uniref:oligogalacturonate-specific porin KdgM family protein n=1 Tax=Serratia entomophila TaxID=42906 RepID=UPI002179E64B|nr:oligogalacturonate-specific porin KdgM family protein [Serratia entomophila]CAI1058259.1 Oligogalacturonate-specific porin kdgM precursor [Serratia entomophila]CAI1790567.1 Oligogalacturonate-specific porin kdgM precursor [Serratia entomophila]CAI1829906.1 Oligogalacturonate-specific porin kdgM precursor [Serratia entomophila]CAI1844412.1 Oligogalacturonate-specific porin kdgM precursor [Serratia entomophila]CAI1914486.1 Oligogalacturonate-specific porin kdgM precursor [Serratia entomophila
MKTINKFMMIAIFSCSTSQAVMLDYRHEYTDVDKTHKDRFLITHRFTNGFGFGLEAMWKNGGNHKNKPYNDIVSNGNEVTMSYQFSATDRLNLQPVFVINSGSAHSGYKPGLYGSYRLTDELSLAMRYRWEYIRHTMYGVEDDKVNRADLWLFYKPGDWAFEYNYFYIHSQNRLRYDNKRGDYEHSVKVQYNIDKVWGPYIAILNKSVRNDTDARQTGFRAGIQYRF